MPGLRVESVDVNGVVERVDEVVGVGVGEFGRNTEERSARRRSGTVGSVGTGKG